MEPGEITWDRVKDAAVCDFFKFEKFVVKTTDRRG